MSKKRKENLENIEKLRKFMHDIKEYRAEYAISLERGWSVRAKVYEALLNDSMNKFLDTAEDLKKNYV